MNPTRRVCEDANTPSGRFTYTEYRDGWDKSPLGQLYNPFYFNGGIAVHGYESVPTYPASHGCTRIPMHIAEYFHTLVQGATRSTSSAARPANVVSSTPIAPTPPPPPHHRRRRPAAAGAAGHRPADARDDHRRRHRPHAADHRPPPPTT